MPEVNVEDELTASPPRKVYPELALFEPHVPPLLTVTAPIKMLVPVAEVSLMVPVMEAVLVLVKLPAPILRVPAVKVKFPEELPITQVLLEGPVTVPVVLRVKPPDMVMALAVQEMPPPTVKVPVTSVGTQVSVEVVPSSFKLT